MMKLFRQKLDGCRADVYLVRVEMSVDQLIQKGNGNEVLVAHVQLARAQNRSASKGKKNINYLITNEN